MLGRSKVYIGPEVALWRRWVLRHARQTAVGLLLVWAVAMLAAVAQLWKAPPGLGSSLLVLVALAVVGVVWAAWERQRLVREAPMPQFLKRKLREAYPHLSGKDTELVERGLRQFFLACLRSRGKFVAMPSRVVDSMWHEFILHTRAYRDWCELVLGRFVDHVPAEALGKNPVRNDGLRRAWYWACKDEAIAPRLPSRLPLLFALDAKLAIANGFHYVPDCSGIKRIDDNSATHCGNSFSDGSYSGEAGSFGGAESSASDGSSSDAGSGDGCGGGGD